MAWVALQVDATIAASLSPRFATDLALACDALSASAQRIGASLPASPAILGVALEVHAHVAASGEVGTGKVAAAAHTNGNPVGWRGAGSAAAAAVFGVRSQLHAFAVAIDTAIVAADGLAREAHAGERRHVAHITTAALVLVVARLAIQIFRQLVGARPSERGEDS